MIGNGNVAIDVARMLVLDPDELAPTDTADHAIEAFADPGPGGRAARPPRPGAGGVHQPRAARAGRPGARGRRGRRHRPRARRRLGARGWRPRPTRPPSATSSSCASYAAAAPKDASHKIVLRFLRSPVEILGEGEDGPVTGIRVVRNEIQRGEDGRLSAVATGDEEVIECGLVLRSIGYRGRPSTTSRSTSAAA